MHPTPTHRPEIDGLRALAVLPVILFHAGFATFSGGYVGVDVFFVISGFLITTIIVNEQATGRFSLAGFYERRARRILPALFAVMAASIPLAWYWMQPKELVGFGKSLLSVAAFVSNIFFWRSSGYFDQAAEEKPLLHTWSLGVEEQYYLVFPLLIVACWRLGTRWLMAILTVVALGSLVASDWLVSRNALATFFLIPTRAWELFAGSLLALAGRRGWRADTAAPAVREALAVLGLAFILAPVFIYDANTPFPGRAALPPVIGTALVLAFATPDTWVGRALCWRPMLWLGLISYSAYLWHQPLFAFARLSHAGRPPVWLYACLIGVTLLLAHLSWRFVEAPFRSRRWLTRRQVFITSGGVTAAAVAVGAALVAAQGVPQRWNELQRQFVMPERSRIEGCPAVDAWLRVCELGKRGQPVSLALVGDSHAYAIGTALDEALAQAGRAGVLVHTDCHPIPSLFDSRERATPARVAYCAEANKRLQAFVAQPAIESVLVAIRWTARLYPMGAEIDAPMFDNQEGGIEGDYPYRRNLAANAQGRLVDAAEPKAAALSRYLRDLAALKPTTVLYPVPEVGWLPGRMNLRAINRDGAPLASISTSWSRFKQRNATAVRVLDSVDVPNLRRVKPESLLCNMIIPGRCAVQAGGKLFYADDDHLSMLGAHMVVDKMLARQENGPLEAP